MFVNLWAVSRLGWDGEAAIAACSLDSSHDVLSCEQKSRQARVKGRPALSGLTCSMSKDLSPGMHLTTTQTCSLDRLDRKQGIPGKLCGFS